MVNNLFLELSQDIAVFDETVIFRSKTFQSKSLLINLLVSFSNLGFDIINKSVECLFSFSEESFQFTKVFFYVIALDDFLLFFNHFVVDYSKLVLNFFSSLNGRGEYSSN